MGVSGAIYGKVKNSDTEAVSGNPAGQVQMSSNFDFVPLAEADNEPSLDWDNSDLPPQNTAEAEAMVVRLAPRQWMLSRKSNWRNTRCLTTPRTIPCQKAVKALAGLTKTETGNRTPRSIGVRNIFLNTDVALKTVMVGRVDTSRGPFTGPTGTVQMSTTLSILNSLATVRDFLDDYSDGTVG